MAKGNDQRPKTVGREVHLTHSISAPRGLVFKAWTDPKYLAEWWGPNGFTNPVCEADARPGGEIRIHMRGPDGTVHPMTGVYQELVEPRRLVFLTAALDSGGHPLFEILNTVILAEEAGKTKLMLHARVVKSTDNVDRYLDGMETGWNQSLERLGKFVVKIRS